MKIISLNIWGGGVGKEKILNFFRENEEVDIFCLQEVWSGGSEDPKLKEGLTTDVNHNVLDDIDEVLKDHRYFFRPRLGDHYGLAIFVKNNIDVIEEGEVWVHKEKGYVPKDHVGRHAINLQYIIIGKENKTTIYNFHGLWNGQGKGDSDDRLLQSDKITEFVKDTKNPFVLTGDFNLLPETESIKRIEELGVSNLITQYNIKSTRTSLYNKDVPFADYMFVSKDIDVKKFKMMDDEVSDHMAMCLEF